MCTQYIFVVKESMGGGKWKTVRELTLPDETMPQADAQKLNDMFRDKIFELLKELTYDQRLIVERLT